MKETEEKKIQQRQMLEVFHHMIKCRSWVSEFFCQAIHGWRDGGPLQRAYYPSDQILDI